MYIFALLALLAGCSEATDSADTGEASAPLVWMHPQATSNDGRNGKPAWDMLASADGWSETLGQLDVFGFFGANVDKDFSQPLLSGAGVQVAVEVGGLRGWQCDGTAFFETVDSPIFDRLVAGGHPDFVASLDAPFTYTVQDGFHAQCVELFASGVGDPAAEFGCDPFTTMDCDYTPDDAARELVEYLALFHERYPQASIGWIEPTPLLHYGQHPAETSPIEGRALPDLAALAATLDAAVSAYDAEHGTDIGFDFFHADAYYTGMLVPVWQETYDPWAKMVAVSQGMQAQGLRFGILLNDYREWLTQPEKDQNFHDSVLAYRDCFLTHGGLLEDLVVESWVTDIPSEVIPEELSLSFSQVMLELVSRVQDPGYIPACDLLADIATLESQL
jgi:hypothetical protein